MRYGSRRQHYIFAHQMLPALLDENRKQILGSLLMAERDEFLRDVWDYVGEQLDGSDERNSPFEPIGLSARVIENSPYMTCIVSLPNPETLPEAHFVAVVFGPFTNLSAETADQVPYRYFALELTYNPDKTERGTMLCEWRDGNHLNMGQGPPPDEDAFFMAIQQVMLEGVTPVASYSPEQGGIMEGEPHDLEDEEDEDED